MGYWVVRHSNFSKDPIFQHSIIPRPNRLATQTLGLRVVLIMTFRYGRGFGQALPAAGWQGTRFTSAYNAFNSLAVNAAGNGCMPALNESLATPRLA